MHKIHAYAVLAGIAAGISMTGITILADESPPVETEIAEDLESIGSENTERTDGPVHTDASIQGNISSTASPDETGIVYRSPQANVSHTITLDDTPYTEWKKTQNAKTTIDSTTIHENGYKSVFVRVSDVYKDKYAIVNVEPSDPKAAEITFHQNTGEVLIENPKTDFHLIPILQEIVKVHDLKAAYEILPQGEVDQQNTDSVRIQYTITAVAENGAYVPNTTIYFQPDDKEPFTPRITDENGQVQFKYTYSLLPNEQQDTFTSLFTTDKNNPTISVNKAWTIIRQSKPTYIPGDRIIAAHPNHADGSISGLDTALEYFTTRLSDGEYIYTGDGGFWQSIPDTGTITNLAAGKYAFRYAQRVYGDAIFLRSGWQAVEVPVAKYTVQITGNHVSIQESSLDAAQNGSVYFHLQTDPGYQLVSYYLDEPDYGNVQYYESDGIIGVQNITKNLQLKINAVPNKISTYTGKPQTIDLDDTTHLLFGIDENNWIETLPTFVQAGTYTVFFQNMSTNDVHTRTVIIHKAPLYIQTGSAVKPYDGTPLQNIKYTVNGLVPNETIQIHILGSQKEVGSSENRFEIIWDKPSQSNNYEIFATMGVLTITQPVQKADAIIDASKENKDDQKIIKNAAIYINDSFDKNQAIKNNPTVDAVSDVETSYTGSMYRWISLCAASIVGIFKWIKEGR